MLALEALPRRSRMVPEDVERSPSTEPPSDVGRKLFGFSHEDVDENGAYYEGHFMFHQKSGHGEYHNPSAKIKYVGQFQADVHHGDGKKTWPDGSRYVGQWRHGEKHGRGHFTSADDLVYDGQWERGRRHGIGTQTYANKDCYRGGWFNGVCTGIGTYTFADGSRYEGSWADGRYDGVGVFYGADGLRERRLYSRGFLVKRERLTGAAPPKLGSRRDFIGSRVIADQLRSEMLKPTRLAKTAPSTFLIRRETFGMDLSVPPLRPKTAPDVLCGRVQDS